MKPGVPAAVRRVGVGGMLWWGQKPSSCAQVVPLPFGHCLAPPLRLSGALEASQVGLWQWGGRGVKTSPSRR